MLNCFMKLILNIPHHKAATGVRPRRSIGMKRKSNSNTELLTLSLSVDYGSNVIMARVQILFFVVFVARVFSFNVMKKGNKYRGGTSDAT